MAMAMAMDMGSMRIDSLMSNRFKLRFFSIAIFLFLNPLSILANSFTFVPTLTLQEMYSDNINLTSENKKGAFVSSISPGIFATAITPKNSLNLNYRMQNVYNAGGDGGLEIFNQLQFNSHSVLALNKLFLDTRSNISQQNINNTRIVTDNLSGNTNRTNVTTFGVSPYWSPSFGNYASGLLRVNLDVIKTDASSQNNLSNTSLTPFSDSVNVAEILQLNSGTEFKRISWNLGFTNTENYRSGGQDVKFQNANALIRTYINQYFNVFVAGGYSNNNFSTSTNSNRNGFFYTVGGKWMPSQHYSIEAGYGNNAYVTVMISPFQRFNWVTTYRNNSIGLNSGETWQTALSYYTRNSNWSITRINDTTTVQTLLSQLQAFPDQNSLNGNININDPNQYNTNNLNYTNDVIVRTTWNLSASYSTGKNRLGLSLIDQDRVYQSARTHERVTGINGMWNWNFALKTSAYLTPSWQKTVSDNLYKNTYYSFTLGVNRQITSFINSRIEFRHINQKSDLIANNYEENRATLSLFMRF